MAEVATTSILRLVFDKLVNKVMNELGLLKGVDEELKKLETTLSTIQDVLDDAEARQVKEKAVRVWLKKLKDVAYEVDDVLDEAAVRSLKHRTNEKVRKLPSTPKSILFRHKIAHKIKEIRKRLDAIAEERSKFHLREGTAKHCEVDGGVREQTGSFVDESEVYGREQDEEQIIDFLINKSSENNLGVIAIVGLGGLGKTTLAQLVYNKQQVWQHFETRIWVYVSDKFDTKSIIRSIIISLTKQECNLPDIDLLQQELMKQIRGKRFLLVLDDVWNENYELWDRLRILLNTGARGSRVLVTTRSMRVASIMGAEKLHFLTGLSDDDCWLLFERRAFEFGSNAKNLKMVDIGKEIVQKCGGMPLAAKALGSLMRFKQEVSQWLAVRDTEIWRLSDDDDNEILPALMLSYNHLPPRLKQCFAYCSIFPKGGEIRIETLVQLWIAEGFVRSYDGSTHPEDVGSQYVDQLLWRSLLERGQKDGDDVVRQVKMHDVVHDLARFVAGDECSIIVASGNTNISPNSCYTSLLFDGNTPSIEETLNNLQKLRTLYLIVTQGIFACRQKAGGMIIYDQNAEEQANDQKVLRTIFSNMKLLRALRLSDFPMEELPATINKLKHLRYLDLSRTGLQTLPQTIGLLHNLQTLKLVCCARLETLPESIGDLVNLLTLDLCKCRRLHSLPDTIGCIGSLRNLDISGAQIQILPESLSSLSNLHSLELRNCYWLHELPKNIQNMRSLTHFNIYSCYGLTSMPAGIGQLCQLRTLPMYVLGDGESNGSLAELGTLDNLEGELYIGRLQNIRNIAEATEANLREKQGLRSLRLKWDLHAYWNQEGYEDVDDIGKILKAFMETVAADDGDHTKLVEDVLGSLQPPQNLEVLQIEGYVGKMLPGWMMDLSVPNLEALTLESSVRCEKLPALEMFSCLKVLKLCTFPFIECLPQLGQLPFLKVLSLTMLPAIKCLGSEFYGGDGAFSALEELELEAMLDLEEWSVTGKEDFLPRLSKLSLMDCPKLETLPSTFPSVKELTMNVDDKLLLSCLELGAFPNLTHLGLHNCNHSDDESSMPEVLVRLLDSVQSSSMVTKPFR